MSATVPSSSGSSHLGAASRNTGIPVLLPPPTAAQFREIHKNTWLKRLSADGKKITVGPKKSERSWVVFCVHDDTEALLEGYAEPRQAASHMPEWIVSLKDTLHISHALIPNLHEFEFVVTLSNEVLRFHSMSWEIMQEWVETLRSKLREMKILSPRENLYTKLPEVRAPLLPTRDPTSPLPAPPPVPAAIVPGVERVIPHQSTQNIENEISRLPTTEAASVAEETTATALPITTNSTTTSSSQLTPIPSSTTTTTSSSSITTAPPNLTSMSNTLTQNLLNMLSDPISTYSEQINETIQPNATEDEDGEEEHIQNGNTQSQATGSTQDLNLSDDEFLSPLLRKACTFNENNVLFDVANGHRSSADQLISLTDLLQFERLIPRPQTSRSMSAGAADKTKKLRQANAITNEAAKKSTKSQISIGRREATVPVANVDPVQTTTTTTTTSAITNTNVTIIQVSTNSTTEQIINNDDIEQLENSEEQSPPKLPTKTITGEIFRFPEITTKVSKAIKQHEYKSNVQIIPSNANSSTIQVLSQSNHSTPVKSNNTTAITTSTNAAINTTMVHVTGSSETTESSTSVPVSVTNPTTTTSVAIYGTCYTPVTAAPSMAALQPLRQQTPKLTKKVILTANPSGITNITISNEESLATVIRNPADADEYSGACSSSDIKHNVGSVHYEKVFLSSSIPIPVEVSPTNTQRTQLAKNCVTLPQVDELTQTANNVEPRKVQSVTNSTQTTTQMIANINGGSPALPPRRANSPSVQQKPISVTRPPMLTRGLTEAVITTRPSRKDFHYMKLMNTPIKSKTNKTNHSNSMVNNNVESNVVVPSTSGAAATSTPVHAAVSRTNAELVEQRRRSSSTSDAQTPLLRTPQRGANNNEFPGNRGSAALRMQQPPQPFRGVETSNNTTGTNSAVSAVPPKRLTLREQQVIQLRREIMHPGGVRLQLRRKDCLGSIAWVDAFGAVWVAGWKQKEHPVLYNALHIGDQLLSIAGVTISNAAEANKIIRNTNTLFLEVLVRRIPFGRAYAIRRDREGQCLGLIRDGNSSTIVDVVPNSLAARHGLPPKAQSCDGTTLTFWMLTEINSRPLNVFFKDNEIRDRLNSVGRDISILVQPSDLITKIKKQLKSLRGYKEYLVQ